MVGKVALCKEFYQLSGIEAADQWWNLVSSTKLEGVDEADYQYELGDQPFKSDAGDPAPAYELDMVIDWLLRSQDVKVKFKVTKDNQIAASCPECFRGVGEYAIDAALALAIAMLKGKKTSN